MFNFELSIPRYWKPDLVRFALYVIYSSIPSKRILITILLRQVERNLNITVDKGENIQKIIGEDFTGFQCVS